MLPLQHPASKVKRRAFSGTVYPNFVRFFAGGSFIGLRGSAPRRFTVRRPGIEPGVPYGRLIYSQVLHLGASGASGPSQQTLRAGT
jgi:hypothetical protein